MLHAVSVTRLQGSLPKHVLTVRRVHRIAAMDPGKCSQLIPDPYITNHFIVTSLAAIVMAAAGLTTDPVVEGGVFLKDPHCTLEHT